MIEGAVVNVPPNGGCKNPMEPGIPFDTSNVLFICGGSFGGLEDIVARRLGREAFGFGPAVESRGGEQENMLRHVMPEDLEHFGFIPELLGRLPVIATLDDLGVEDLARILTEPTNSLIGQFTKLLAYHGADLKFTDGAIREIARLAHARGTGARGLRMLVEQVLEGVLFEPVRDYRYTFTEEAVRGGEPLVVDTWFGSPISPSKRENPAAPLRHRLGRRTAGG
jgi:ATP-dependent Clp protease ATP-binding subunit ClpX